MRNNSGLFLGVVILLLLSTSVWGVVLAEGDRSELRVVFLDVGQGDATYIEAPNGRQLLIDGGASGSVIARELGRVMPFWDRSINVVMATHPDLDHIGGLPEVFARFDIDYFLEPGAESETEYDDELLRLVSSEGSQYMLAKRGQRLWLDETAGVYLDILYPDQEVSDYTDPNDASIVARLVYGKTEFLLTGDAPKEVEEYLVWLDSDVVTADVLKVGHHGSRTSTSDFFVGWVDPEYAVISAGKDNRYGHPHEEVLETLEQFEIETINTAEVGRVEFVSDGESLAVRH